jgi:hypothetical protein
MTVTERYEGMAYLGFPEMVPLPWFMLAPHEAQVRANHGQSLAQLAARGGLAPAELLAVLEDRPWTPMPAVEAIGRITKILEAYCALHGWAP